MYKVRREPKVTRTEATHHNLNLQQQDMWHVTPEFGKDNSGFLTVTQFCHFLNLHPTTHTKPSQILSLFLSRIARILLFKKLQWSHFQVQDVHKVLCKPTHFQMAMWSDIPHCRLQFTCHKLYQGCFTDERRHNE